MNIGDLVADGQLIVAMLIALAAGLVSFASPCVLPLVPGYLAYIGGLAGSDQAETSNSAAVAHPYRRARNRLILGVTLFVAGFSVIFVAFMVLASSVGIWLVQYQDLITRIMGVIVIVMGLVFVGMFRPMQQTRKLSIAPRVGLIGAPLLGAGFAIGWTPCLGPTLIAITSLSLQSGSVLRGAVLGLMYCLGLGIPFVLVAIGFGWVASSTQFLKRNIRTINIIGGVVLVIIGVLMVTGVWNQMMYSLQAVMNAYVPAI
jgi:cytochrome c-type biogenesis protein